MHFRWLVSVFALALIASLAGIGGGRADAAPPEPPGDVIQVPAATGTATSASDQPVILGPVRGDIDARLQYAEVNDPSFARLTAPQSSPGAQIDFDHISVEQGLSQNTVLSILQDSLGFMWFGTGNGLNKYDGYTFTVYRATALAQSSLANGLSDDAIQVLYEDRSGTLWIGTERGGLNRLDRETGQFTAYRYDPADPASISADYVRAIYQDQAGALWVGTNGGGLNRLDLQTGQFTRFQNVPNDPGSLSHNNVLALAEDRTGTLWVGTNSGLDRYVPETGHFVHYRYDARDSHSLAANSILALYIDQSDVLWIGTGGGGLDRLDPGRTRFQHYRHDPADPTSLGEDVVWAIHEDVAGALWIGTYSQGLDRLDVATGRFTHFRNDFDLSHSLSTNRVRAIYADRSGVLWVGTSGAGLNKSDVGKKRFVHYRNIPGDSNSLSDNNVFPIYEDQAGLLWVGTGDGGLDALDRTTGQWRHYRENPADPSALTSNRIWALWEDRAGMLWIGTAGGGLNRRDPATGTFTRYRHDPANPASLSDDDVFVLSEDRAGTLWVGTLGGGLDRLDRETGRFVRYKRDPNDPQSLVHNSVRAIYEDQAGVLWVGTAGGLCSMNRDTGRFTCHRHDPADPQSLSADFILAIYEDRAGALWIGTNGGGLDRFDRQTGIFQHYREGDGLPNNVVYGILEDDDGHLWLSTNLGLARFDPRTGDFRNYDERDGLQSNEFNANAYHKARSGEMFFGGVNGLNAFFPAQVADNPYIPAVVLTSLTQAGEAVELGEAVEFVKRVTLRWPYNYFEFEFAALGYRQPAKNQYAYMLQDFDKTWNYVGTQRFGRYTNIPGGTYTLRVKGSNNDGVWNEAGAAVTVTVIPPIWETWWLRGIVILTVIGGIVGGYRLRVSAVEARNRQLEAQVSERTSEIERRRVVAEGLRQILVILNSDRPLQESLDYIVARTAVLTDAGGTVALWREEDAPRPLIALSPGLVDVVGGEGFPESVGSWFMHVVASGQPWVAPALTGDDVNLDGAPAWLRACGALLAIPLSVGEETRGALVVLYAQKKIFSDEDLDLVSTLADQATLAIANAQLRDRAEQTAVETERSRLARDLHDAVTQTLFSASLIAEALPAIWESDQADGRQLLGEMRRLIRSGLAEMRTLLVELRPAALVEANLGALLRQLAEATAGRKHVSIQVDDKCVVPTDVHVAFYRIAQEALNNAIKHAHASQIKVNLRRVSPASETGAESQAGVELIVSDDGRGFDPACVPPDCLGLNIMRERAQAVVARFNVQSQPGAGTRVSATWGG